MSWESFYLICFLVGLALSALSLLAGVGKIHLSSRWHIPGASAHHAPPGVHVHSGASRIAARGAHVSFFNFSSMMAFLAWFGGTGYLLTRYSNLWGPGVWSGHGQRFGGCSEVQEVEKIAQVKVQEAEIQRRSNELIATVLKAAEIDRQKIQTLADAEKQRLIAEAEGKAASIRAQGEAEAEIIFKKGEAEAKAMNIKAEAYQEYNQAAVVDKLFTSLPEVVRAMAAPLGNVDKITIVSTGNGDSAGTSKLTADMAKIAAQVPALFEALSGMEMSELLGKVRKIGDKASKADGPGNTPPALPAK